MKGTFRIEVGQPLAEGHMRITVWAKRKSDTSPYRQAYILQAMDETPVFQAIRTAIAYVDEGHEVEVTIHPPVQNKEINA